MIRRVRIVESRSAFFLFARGGGHLHQQRASTHSLSKFGAVAYRGANQQMVTSRRHLRGHPKQQAGAHILIHLRDANLNLVGAYQKQTLLGTALV